MTKRELSQLYYLNREIAEQERRLKELESAAESATQRITGMPNGGGMMDKISHYATEIAYLKGIIQCSRDRCWYELAKLTEYINSVDDCLVRMVLTLRHVNGLSWLQVATSIGGDNTADGVRKIHDRYLENNKNLSVLSAKKVI